MLRNGPPQHRRDLRRRKARPAVHQVAVDAARLRHCAARVVARGAHQGRVTVRDGRGGHVEGGEGTWEVGWRCAWGAGRGKVALSTGSTHRSMAAAREGSARPSGAQRRYTSEASQQLAWFGLRRGLGEGLGLGLGLGLRLGLALNQPQS